MCQICANLKPYTKNEELCIYYCSRNEIIPYIKNVKRIKLYYNMNLKYIENSPNLEELTIVECPLILDIPKINRLKKIQIRKCQYIKPTFDINNIELSVYGKQKKELLLKKIKIIDYNNILPDDIIQIIYKFII